MCGTKLSTVSVKMVSSIVEADSTQADFYCSSCRSRFSMRSERIAPFIRVFVDQRAIERFRETIGGFAFVD